MRRTLFVCSFLAAAVMMTGTALAGPAPKPAAPQKVDKCVKDKHGIIRCDLSGSEIPGVLVTPKGVIITGGTHNKWPTLIDYRVHFIPEFIKTVEEL